MGEKRVLIIDDEVLVRRAMADYLIECGYQTAAASDGIEGLALAQAGAFDIVLVDLRMPKMDGLDLITAMNAKWPELPLVVVSGAGLLSHLSS